jgi:hypothetical protein
MSRQNNEGNLAASRGENNGLNGVEEIRNSPLHTGTGITYCSWY